MFFSEALALRGAEIGDGFRPRKVLDSFGLDFVPVFLGILATLFVLFERASSVRSEFQLYLWAKRVPLTSLSVAVFQPFLPH